MSLSAPRHGYYCGNICRILGNHVAANGLGRVMTNDSGIVTEREPDSVRGADVAFYSFTRLPRGLLPEGYLEVSPELVFEVRCSHRSLGQDHREGERILRCRRSRCLRP